MATKNMNTRVIHKHDTEANWIKAVNFIPKLGELIIYDKDDTHTYPRFKVGDGTTVVSSLPFTDVNKVDKITGKGLSTNDYTTAEKEKLAGIEAGANYYAHPEYTAKASGLYKVTVDKEGHVSTATTVTKEDITALGIPGQDTNTTYSVASSTANGLMSKEDKIKLDGIETGAEVNQNAFSNIKVGSSIVTADAKTDTVELVAGTNIGITAADDKITITGTSYTHPSTHPATMITEDTTHRFVTDEQITAWEAKASSSDLSSHINNKSNPHAVTKTQVGLSNVTNDAQVKRTEMGVPDGVATLNENGLIPSSQLPSFVDDVIEGYYYDAKFYKDSSHATLITGETGKIYTDLSGSNKIYRWSGTTYVVISETLALGETDSTAYAGNKGKANADAIATINTKLNTIEEGANKYTHPTYTAKSSGLYKITVDGTGHVSATTAVAKADITALGIPAQDTTYGIASSTANGLMSKEDKIAFDELLTRVQNIENKIQTAVFYA